MIRVNRTRVQCLGCADLRLRSTSSWQNGIAERWVESCRRDLLDHVIALNDNHLRRLLFDLSAIT